MTAIPDRPAIIVPADPALPVRLDSLPADPSAQLDWAQRLVGGWVERAVYDPDACLLVNQDGMALRLPINDRATRYVRRDSTAAARHEARGQPWPAGYVLVGDVIVVGLECTAESERWRGVPARLAQAFELPR
jgi:Domain of unknown function (DUF3846)